MADQVAPRTKRPGEVFPISWDFAKSLEAGESVQSVITTAADAATGDDVTMAFLESPTLAGSIARITLKNGVDGKNYDVTFQATTSAGAILQRVVRVLVRSRP